MSNYPSAFLRTSRGIPALFLQSEKQLDKKCMKKMMIRPIASRGFSGFATGTSWKTRTCAFDSLSPAACRAASFLGIETNWIVGMGKTQLDSSWLAKQNQVHVVHLYIYIYMLYIYIHVTYRYRYMICESDVFNSRLHWLPHHTARHQATNQCQSSSAESPDIDPVVAPATTSPKLSPLVA